MAITIKVSDKVGFSVKGCANDADGTEQGFDFTLTAKRLKETELATLQATLVADAIKTGNNAKLMAELAKLITNWSGVRDETDAAMAFSQQALADLCESYKGLALLIWHSYNTSVGAKAKN